MLCTDIAESASLQEVLQSNRQVLTDGHKEIDEAEERAEEENGGEGVHGSSIASETTEADTAQEDLDSEFHDDSDANSCISAGEEIYKSTSENG